LVAAKDCVHKKAQREFCNGVERKENIWKRTKPYSGPSDHTPLWGRCRWSCFLNALSILQVSASAVSSGDLQMKLQPHSASSR